MAVYKRRYNSYTGSLTPAWSRFFVLTRFAFADLFKSRFFVLLLILCIVPCLFFAGFIFVANNKTLQLLMQLRPDMDFFKVESQYFIIILTVQTQAAFLLNCWVGPVLISGDLTNGALPLFLSRPFSRGDYVLGKLAVRCHLDSLLAPVLPSGWAGKKWLDLVAFVDGHSYSLLLRDLDPDAFPHLSSCVSVGQAAHCCYWNNLHHIFYPRRPRRDVQRHHGHLLGRTTEFLESL
jgi:hypothetical protein